MLDLIFFFLKEDNEFELSWLGKFELFGGILTVEDADGKGIYIYIQTSGNVQKNKKKINL